MRLVSLIISAFLLCACSMPRVIVLNDPLDARDHNNLGVSYQQREEFELAVREYNRAAELDTAWGQPLINRGNVHSASGMWREAEKSYRQALKREPGNPEAMNNLAWVLLRSGETAEAFDWARKAVAAGPQEPAYLDTLAEIQIAGRDPGAARLTLKRALTLTPDPELRQSLEKKLASLDSHAF